MTARDIVMSAAGSAGDSKTYIEDVFSTYLFNDTGSTQTINNGIDLAGKGGMVWVKPRSTTGNNVVWDSARGTSNYLVTNSTAAQDVYGVTFNSNGFTFPGLRTGATEASWTFRKAPKFFDVVTYTGNGTTQTISHSLGINPGMIIVKAVDLAGRNWSVYTSSVGATGVLWLNMTNAAQTVGRSGYWNNTSPTASSFTVGNDTDVNASGTTYVAYLFANDTTTDGLIQCGSFTQGATAGQLTTTLGWEPQYLLVKRTDSTGGYWYVTDIMRGLPAQSTTSFANDLSPNVSAAEQVNNSMTYVNSTGFSYYTQANATYIYMAIRRGPMRTPTDGTKVFAPVARTGTGANATITAGFPVDTVWEDTKAVQNLGFWGWDRLRGANNGLRLSGTNVESAGAWTNMLTGFDSNTGVSVGSDNNGVINYSGWTYINYFLQRAPGFFDVVCWRAGASYDYPEHSLKTKPELVIVKSRSATGDWVVAYDFDPAIKHNTKSLRLNTTAAAISEQTYTAHVYAYEYSLGLFYGGRIPDFSNQNVVAYLFASCPGVSKVFSFTGNGSSQTINCGFTNGARLVLIKRTDSTGDWYVWDTARGIISGNDPHLSLNSTAAEVTTNDTIDPDSTGFIVNQVSATNVNVNGASYIGLAIA